MSNTALTKLHAHLKNFNADTANMIRGYWHETGLKIGLIFDMMKIRERLENESNPDLNRKFKQLKLDFVNYISEKIKGEKTTDQDDLLFEIDEVARFQLTEAKDTVVNDIKSSTLSDSLKRKLLESLADNNYQAALAIISEIKD